MDTLSPAQKKGNEDPGSYDDRDEEDSEEGYGQGDVDEEQLKIARLDAFGVALAVKRGKAISYRQQSGIEEIWREDQDFYEGVDDLNRGDERSIRTDKPPVSGGSSRSAKSGAPRGVSRVFPNITAPFCEAGAAHMSDILLPTEDRPWSLEPTPIPELQEKAEQYAKENPEQAELIESQGFLSKLANRLSGKSRNEIERRDDAMIEQDDQITPEEAFEKTEIAKGIAEAAQTRIWDWHIECQFNAHVREAIEDASRLGVGIMKGPVPREQMDIGWDAEHEEVNEEGVVENDEFGESVMIDGEIKLTTDTKPISKRIDCWNLYPAPGSGDNIQNGDYIWERDFLTIRQLRGLKHDESFNEEQIDRCLEEKPTRAIALDPETNSLTINASSEDKYEIWYGYCMAEKDDLEAAGCDCEGIKDANIDTLVVLVNNRCIKATLPTTDYGGFPYDVFSWRKRKNFWAGIGVSRQVRTAQKIVVGATRSMMNNAGLAGGPMIVFKQGVVRPADGVAGLAPRKIFYIMKDDQTISDATKAIGQIKVDIMVNEMMAIINYGLQQAENNSGFPMLMQGQMGGAPELVGVVNVLDKNTNAIKRRLGRNFSDQIMTPHLRRYYIYHLMYGPDNEKGDLQVNVKGYASLVERDIRNQELGQMQGIVLEPRFKLDPEKWAEEYLKSRHLPVSSLKVDDQQWGEMLQQFEAFMEYQGSGDTRLQIENIRQKAATEREHIKGQFAGAIQLSEVQARSVSQEMDRKLELVKQAANAELTQLQQSGADQKSVRESKTKLAKAVMEIQATWKLAMSNARAADMPTPPIEPPGRAPVGESFTK